MVSFTSLPLYPKRKILWYPLDRTLGGPIGDPDAMEEKNLSPAGNQILPDQPTGHHYTG
jgi:hypothetical protein